MWGKLARRHTGDLEEGTRMRPSFTESMAALVLIALVTGIAASRVPVPPEAPRNPPQPGVGLGEFADALMVLTQYRGTESRKKLDALADSLTAIAISETRGDVESVETHFRVVEVLARAGEGRVGIAYPGAAERLLRIAQATGSGGALSSLTRMPDRAQAIQLVRRVAYTETMLGSTAVGHLARDMGPEGLAAARELHEHNFLVGTPARCQLAILASYHGW